VNTIKILFLGGPLQVSNEENVHCTYTQIGISSFGPGSCGQIGVASKRPFLK